jgi:hypothetical protein
MMRCRAQLIDPGAQDQERPKQVFAQERGLVDEWAHKVLENAVADNAVVLVYEMVEQQIGVIRKAKEVGA